MLMMVYAADLFRCLPNLKILKDISLKIDVYAFIWGFFKKKLKKFFSPTHILFIEDCFSQNSSKKEDLMEYNILHKVLYRI